MCLAWAVHRRRRLVDAIVGRDLRELTPDGSVLFSMFHSGTARYYGNRMTVRYDWLPEDALDSAVDILSTRGVRSYFLLESWEIELARQRFGAHSAAGTSISRQSSSGTFRTEWLPCTKRGGRHPSAQTVRTSERSERLLILQERPPI
jgi:hypothetical protein